MQELIKIKTNEQGEQLVSARELYLELGMNVAHWKRWSDNNIKSNEFFIEGIDYQALTIMVNHNETSDYCVTLEMAKHLCMISRTEKAHEIRKYFIECEKRLKQQQIELTNKDLLYVKMGRGGAGALQAHKELLEIETEELKQQHELEMKTQRDGNNKILSGVYEVVSMLGIQGLTVAIFNQWMVYKGLIEYKRFDDDKKDTAQPTELFFKYVAKEGYSLTSAPNNKGKIKMIYTTEFVNRILDEHFKSLIDYVKITE